MPIPSRRLYDAPTPPPMSSQFPNTMGSTTLFIYATVVCCAITVFSVLIVVLVRPENKDAITTIIAIMAPITMAFLAAAINGVQKGVNGRFSQLLTQTADQATIQGRAAVIKQLYYQLSQMDPETPEFTEMSKTIRLEAMRHFEALEQRTTGAATSGDPVASPPGVGPDPLPKVG